LKLILKIALGVFLGALASQMVMEVWHAHQERLAKEAATKVKTEHDKARREQAERVRSMLMQGFRGKAIKPAVPPPELAPDGAQGTPGNQ
jgi:hypothetical protein